MDNDYIDMDSDIFHGRPTTDISSALYRQTLGTPSINTPFGSKRVIYADTMASGIIFSPIEDKMRVITKYYSNTHSNAHNGKLMLSMITQSKDIIRSVLNTGDNDQVIFTANGASGAIKHLIHLLDLGWEGMRTMRPTVLISEMEHHSNHLPWKHLPIDLDIIPVTATGCLDIKILKSKLRTHYNKYGITKDLYVSLSAGSNVTGVMCDRHLISTMVHKYKGKLFLDCAAIAPYEKINMHKDDSVGDYFDAVYISPHKMLGGPGAVGVLVASKCLFINKIPFIPGGGTVRFVCREFQVYSSTPEIKESGGTPNILGCIRAGLAFDLKSDINDFILHRDHEILSYVDGKIRQINNITILNPKVPNRLPVFSFMVNRIHYNLVVVLLNDLFGIQSRGGISCCSLLAQKLLGYKPCDKDRVYKSIVGDKGVPDDYGWTRVSFHYTMTNQVVDYIIKAIEFISKNGHKFEQYYIYDPKSNNWTFNNPDYKPLSMTYKLTWRRDMIDSEMSSNTKYLTSHDISKQYQRTINDVGSIVK